MGEALLQDITGTTGLYYYLTMKEFERAESRRGKKKSLRFSEAEKKVLHFELKENLPVIFSYPKLRKSVAYKSVRINNYEDLFTFLSNVNLFDFIRKAELLDSSFPCVLVQDNQAWISKTENGHFRYFTKSKNRTIVGLDLIDLLEIYHNCSTSEAVQIAVKDFKIKFMEDVWLENQNNKYLSNLTLIHGAEKRIKDSYPSLHQLIKEHFKVLETFNVIANINVKKQEFSFKGQNIFFASNSYVSGFLGNYTLSTTNKVINLFAVLGLVHKLKEEVIPPQLLHESITIADQRNLGNIVSYYIIPDMSDVLEEAERRAQILISHRVSYTSISRSKILSVFGEDFTNDIYVQEIQKGKKHRASIPYILSKQLEKHTLLLLEKHGYTTKKMIVKKSVPHTKSTDRSKALELIWKSMVEKHALRYCKPSKEMKERYGLKTSEYILLKA